MYAEFSNKNTGRDAVSKEQVSKGGEGYVLHIQTIWGCAALKGIILV